MVNVFDMIHKNQSQNDYWGDGQDFVTKPYVTLVGLSLVIQHKLHYLSWVICNTLSLILWHVTSVPFKFVVLALLMNLRFTYGLVCKMLTLKTVSFQTASGKTVYILDIS